MIAIFKNKFGQQRPGLTLLTSLIVIVLVAIALIPLLRALSTSLFVSAETESNIVALNLAQGEMEEMRSLPYESITSKARAEVEKHPGFESELIVTSPQTNLKKITVIVYWKTAGIEQSVSFETYAANY